MPATISAIQNSVDRPRVRQNPDRRQAPGASAMVAREWTTGMLNRVQDPSGAERAAALLDRARQLGPLIEGAADRIESEREIPADLLAALHEARLFRMLIPRSCDG